MKKTLRKHGQSSENNLHQIRLTDPENQKTLLAKQEASSARLLEVVAALRRVYRGGKEKKGKMADMLTKVKWS